MALIERINFFQHVVDTDWGNRIRWVATDEVLNIIRRIEYINPYLDQLLGIMLLLLHLNKFKLKFILF